MLSTSHLTAIFAGYTVRKLNFQQSQWYNIVLLCGSVNTVNIQCNLSVLHQGEKGILENMTQAISTLSKCHMIMIV